MERRIGAIEGADRRPADGFTPAADHLLVWLAGSQAFRINAAVLMEATAGARSHSASCAEIAAAIGSSVPWIGFSVGYAVAGVLLTVSGYLAMLL